MTRNAKYFTIVVCLLLAVGTIIIGVVSSKPSEEGSLSSPSGTVSKTESMTEIVIQIPEISESETASDSPSMEISDGMIHIEPVEETSEDDTSNEIHEESVEITEPIVPVDKPVEQEDPDDVIVIGGPITEPYHCDTEGHHCASAEAHAYLLNLELEGCKTCGSHRCPSFYCLDEWGQTRYDPKQCPDYNVYKDPLHYCQRCGKKCGDGQNGTCAEYNIDIECPACGEQVKAWTCHSCR